MPAANWTGVHPDYGYIARLAVVAAVLVAAPFALHLLHERGLVGSRRSTALLVMAIFVVLLPVIASAWSAATFAEAPAFVAVTLIAVWFTYLGIGSPLLMSAFRFAWVQLGALGTLMSRANGSGRQSDSSRWWHWSS